MTSSHYTTVNASCDTPFTSATLVITLVLLLQKAILELIQPYIEDPPFYLAHTFVLPVKQWGSSSALKHSSTYRQVPQKGCSIPPSKLPRSCPATHVDSAGLLAPTSSISHADVPHTRRRKWGKKQNKRYVHMKEGKRVMAEGGGKLIISSLWRNINPSPCCNSFSFKLVLHSAMSPKGLVEVLFFPALWNPL